LDASFNEPLTLVDDLVGVKTRWHDGGDNKVLETSSKVLRIHVRRAFEVRERVLVGVVGINPCVNVVLEEGPFG
jgi:hypothetical protein